jgi:CDP-diacylglycerol--glycerol-3-phosphate 3-phosphatidyltransferase
MKINIPLNIPNILSLYRLLSFPFVLYAALKGYENIFTLLLCINLVTDILDGLIARKFNMMTNIGARLDSIADLGTYILAFTGIYCFKAAEFQPHIFSFSIFIGLFVFCNLLALLKFKKFPSLHLYSWKIGGYIQGIFFFCLFVFGFNTIFYYVMLVWGIAAFLEHICVQLLLKEMRSNAKGLYWVLRDHRSGAIRSENID